MGEPLTPQQQAAVEHASFLVAGREVLVGEGEEYDYGDEYDLAEVPTRRVPQGSIYEAARVGDVERIQQLLEDGGANVNQRDRWDSVPLYYACLAGHMDAARALLEAGAICNEHTFDGDRCHYAALNLRIRRLLKQYEMRPPPMAPLQRTLKDVFELAQAAARAQARAQGALLTSLQNLSVSGHSSCGSYAESSATTSTASSSSSSSRDSSTTSLCSDGGRRGSAASVHHGDTAGFHGANLGNGMAAEAQEEVSIDPSLEPDVVFVLESDGAKPRVAAHRAVLAARSEYFREAFAGRWRHKREIQLANPRLTLPVLHSLLGFFYSDRLDIDSDELPALARACRKAGCTEGLVEGVERECFHLRHARAKMPLMSMDELGKARPRRGMHLRRLNEDGALEDTPTPAASIQKRCILQAATLPEQDRLPAAMQQLRGWCLANSFDPPLRATGTLEEFSLPPEGASAPARDAAPGWEHDRGDAAGEEGGQGVQGHEGGATGGLQDDFADVCLLSKRGRHFRCHHMVLASRSDFFKVLFSHSLPTDQLPYHGGPSASPPPQGGHTLGRGKPHALGRGTGAVASASSDAPDSDAGSCSCSEPLGAPRETPGGTDRAGGEGCSDREGAGSAYSDRRGGYSDRASGGEEGEGGGEGTASAEQRLKAGEGKQHPCQCCRDESEGRGLPHIPILDVEDSALELMLEYMYHQPLRVDLARRYTDRVECLAPGEAEGLLDAACRFLLFPLKRAVADALLPHLQEAAAPPDLCDWLLLADFYGVWKLREYCLDVMAANFEELSANRQFRQMLRALPPPSGDSSRRTTAPAVPGHEVGLPAPLGGSAKGEGGSGEGGGVGGGGDAEGANVLDDLREKWLEMEGAELEERDMSAAQFDARLMELAAWGQDEDAAGADEKAAED